MSEANAAQALQDWIHEMIAQRKAGFRSGAGGSPSGEVLWLYFSRGDAVESRLVLRAGMRDGKPVVLVDRLEGDSFEIVGRMSKLDQDDPARS
jgi:hypothetical protein